jgi:hypothetical protein
MAENRLEEIKNPGRRNALKRMAMGTGAAAAFPILGQPASAIAVRSDAALPGGSRPAAEAGWKPLFFDAHQNETVVVLTDLIIPDTDTPGAKAAQVNRVIDRFLNEEDAGTQQKFLEGLAWIDGRSLAVHGTPFVMLTKQQQTALLEPLADGQNNNPDDRPGITFFEQIKDSTIFGYYTSEIGMEQELKYQGDQYNQSFPGACTHPEHQS